MAQDVARTRIKDLPTGERPRERLARVGEGALSTTELLAIILRTGVGGESALDLAQRLLSRYKGLAGLARADFAELRAEKGLGEAKTAQLKAALELGRRLLLAALDDRPVVHSPTEVAQLLQAEMAHQEQEHLRVLYLDTRNRVIGADTVSIGGLNTSYIRVADVFRRAVRQGCASIIIAHNHPSGDPSPSRDDVELTRRLVAAGRLLDIEVLDHLVIGQGRFVSMRERGLGFDDEGRI